MNRAHTCCLATSNKSSYKIMDVKIISKKMIKPSVPTPSHLKKMNISFIDQLLPPKTVPFIFHYPANSKYQPPELVDQKKKRLETSLAQVLTLFYPLAGRYIKEYHFINCNDDGVEYAEALVNGQLSQILRGKIEPKELNRFVLDELEESATSALVAIQINIFNCGGLAIGLRVSHRIIDGFTLSMFTNGWAKACKVGNINDVTVPNFGSGTLFPPRENIFRGKLAPHSKTSPKVATKRFVFDAKTISKLKEEAMSSSGLKFKPKPSTTEVLIALIWRAQINAASARHGRLRTSLLEVIMSLRGKKFKNIPDNCCGNLTAMIYGRFQGDDETKMGLNDFVDQVRDAISNSIVENAKALEAGEDGLFSTTMKARMDIDEEMRKGDLEDVHSFSSLINFPLYDVDFGWGMPAWVSMTQRTNKVVSLLARKDGDGVEAWVSMEEDDMIFFENDPDIGISMKQVSRSNEDGILITHSKI